MLLFNRPNCIYKLSIFQGKFSTQPDFKKIDRPELLKKFRYETRNSKEGPLFCPAEFKAGTTRKAHNVEKVHGIVFDLDSGVPYTLPPAGFEFDYVAYTTHSNTKTDPKWRLYIPLKRPVIGAEWKYAHKAAVDLWNTLYPEHQNAPDKSCSDASRMYYLPSCHPDRRELFRFDSRLKRRLYQLDYDYIIKREVEAKRELEEFIAFQKARREFEKKYKKSHPSHTDLDREAKIGYATKQADRSYLADRLGCTIRGNRATGFICPACGRSDATYFYLEPNVVTKIVNGKKILIGVNYQAYCGHLKSCGHQISLHELAKNNGIN